jgi:hypothetical protein
MTYIPGIIVKQDLAQEVDVFYKFLHHPRFPGNRNKILRIFPRLEQQLANNKDEKATIKEFLEEFYDRHKETVTQIVQENTKLFADKSNQAIDELGKLMEYDWPENITYIAVPTILPFSPFDKNTFFFSILAELNGKKQEDKNALSVGVHEISHFIFFKQLKQLEIEKKIPQTSNELQDYLKEALAVVLLNERPLQQILGIKNYHGNPELQNLYISKDNETLAFNYWLSQLYQASKSQQRPFMTFLQDAIVSLVPMEQDLKAKRELWNQIAISEGEELKKLKGQYAKPIERLLQKIKYETY